MGFTRSRMKALRITASALGPRLFAVAARREAEVLGLRYFDYAS